MNDVGLLSEEYDPRVKRLVGNFPQAFSHMALVNCAYNLTRATKPVEQRAQADIRRRKRPRRIDELGSSRLIPALLTARGSEGSHGEADCLATANSRITT